MRLLPKNSAWVKFERAQARTKKPRAGRTTARLKFLVMRAKADIAARRGATMEYGFLLQKVHCRIEARERGRKR